MRGKHSNWVYRDYTLGNIPAYAGKTMLRQKRKRDS